MQGRSRAWTRRAGLVLSAWLGAALAGGESTLAQAVDSGEAQWIWSSDGEGTTFPPGAVYFRKVFSVQNPEVAQIEITADDRYELYVNGRRVGAGQDWKKLDTYDLLPLLFRGRNVIAVRAENSGTGAAGMVASVSVRNKGNTDVSYSTDGTWRASTEEARFWQQPNFREDNWKPARVLGELGQAAPWGDQVMGAAGRGRFRIASEFRVERVARPDQTGSLVAMAFNELGQIIASRERGPLLLIQDQDQDGSWDVVSTYCDQLTNCHGILPLNGQVFAVGDGPEKTGFYRLTDSDRDGVVDDIKLLFKFVGGMGEHGPHAPVLGPDGFIYLMIGNHARAEPEYEPTSPLLHYYEGDLVQPRYEDAGGHAHGIKAPGGTVIRTDVDGSFVELYAGGFRNAYDMAFNRQGDLFTFDSDMEWDVGLPWYRPTRVNHVVPGAEFGWRSGWANWPAYFFDSLPATIDIGRGSPTGVECYNHYMFPARYHNALFLADWSLGRIVAVRLQSAGGSYQARSEIFLQGRPLNVTDLAVGPDGWLYFSTGGRGTEGGLYRVRWLGKVPPRPKYPGVMPAIRQPQLTSAWGRNRVANLKLKLGDAWDSQLEALALDARAAAEDRTRALDLMQLVGPFPGSQLLLDLSETESAEVRAKAAYLMGVNAGEDTASRLVELLDDEDPGVRRHACQALLRSGQSPPVEQLLELAADPAVFVRWAARMALERAPVDQWQSTILSTDNPRLFVEGAAALLALDPQPVTVNAVLARASEVMRGFVADQEFLALLRVIQVALDRGKIAPDAAGELRQQLAEEYPSLNPEMNRELVRLLAYLQPAGVTERMMEQLANDEVPLVEKLHVAFYARFLNTGWTLPEKMDLLAFYEYARDLPGGHSFKGYIDNVCRDFVGQMTEDELWAVLDRATELPNGALMALYRLPEHPSAEVIARLIEIDRQLTAVDSEAARRLGTGIVAVLGSSRDAEAMKYLREAFERTPDRREDLAMGLAQEPNGENFPLLLRSLPVVEGAAAREVLARLSEVDQVPEQPEPLRQVILCGLKLKEEGAKYSLAILEKWTGEKPYENDAKWDAAMATWQQWFAEKYPDLPPAVLPTSATGTRWALPQLVEYLASADGQGGNAARGERVFTKAQCVKCHRYGSRGEGLGPDLTTVSQRFQRKEILESVLHPSQVISDQYASKTVLTNDGRTFTGIVDPSRSDVVVILESNGEKREVPRDQIDEIVPSSKSAMPEGLFDELTLDEISDLFAFLSRPPAVR